LGIALVKASLKIEAIGNNSYQEMRLYRLVMNECFPSAGDILLPGMKKNYWVAKICGVDNKFGYAREFIRGKTDYRNANSKGSRGVYIYYILESDNIYEILQPITWIKSKRWFCQVDENGDIIEIDKESVNQWLKNRLA